ncbi:MAG: hypothetical protein ACK5JT_05920 [Hyphomicrobiaceae bacterium]
MLFKSLFCRDAGGARPLAIRASCIGLVGLASLTAGCATQQNAPSRVAGPVPRQALASNIDMEADGLPAQLAPSNRRALPDDPREPWSHNYGSVDPDGTPTAASVSPPPATPAALRVDTKSIARKLSSAPSRPWQANSSRPMDADEIVRRAIAEYEKQHN